MKYIFKYALFFLAIMFLKATANPIIILYISEIVPVSNTFSMEIITSEIESLDGWYLTSLTDTSYLENGLSVNGDFIVITQDSLKSYFSIDSLQDEISLWSPNGQMDHLIYGDFENSSVSSPKPGQSICLNEYYEVYQQYYYYLDSSPTFGSSNDTSGALGTMNGFITDSTSKPVEGVEIIYDYKEISEGVFQYYTVFTDSNGYFIFDNISRKTSLYLKSESGFGEYLLTEQIYPDDTVSVQILYSISDLKTKKIEPNISSFTLEQNYPNPFNNSTTFHYDLGKREYIVISIYDLRGRLVEQLYSGYHKPGTYKMVWNAENIASGIYVIKLNTISFSVSRKCVYLK